MVLLYCTRPRPGTELENYCAVCLLKVPLSESTSTVPGVVLLYCIRYVPGRYYCIVSVIDTCGTILPVPRYCLCGVERNAPDQTRFARGTRYL